MGINMGDKNNIENSNIIDGDKNKIEKGNKDSSIKQIIIGIIVGLIVGLVLWYFGIN